MLKSPLHLRFREERGPYLRSVLVGLQFATVHIPGEILDLIIKPFVMDVFSVIFQLFSNIIFVGRSTLHILAEGFSGRLEASDSITLEEVTVLEDE